MATPIERIEEKMTVLEQAVKEKLDRLAELETKEAKRKVYKSKWHKEWKSSLTPEQLEEVRKTERERKVKEREEMTEEQREAVRKADRERKSKTNLTPEQLEARRTYNREYKRKQRETKTPITTMAEAVKEMEKGNVVETEVKPDAPNRRVYKKR
jgi:hypothetical protein